MKVGAEAVTSYMPGFRLGAAYSPAELVSSSRLIPVSVLRMTHTRPGHDGARRIRHAADDPGLVALCGRAQEIGDDKDCYEETGSKGFHVSPKNGIQ